MPDIHLGRADAVLVPERLKRGSREILRIDSVMKITVPLLGVVWTRGDRVYIRKQEGPTVGRDEPMLFCTRSILDTLNYSKGDPKNRQGSRYDWVSDGCLALGYLKDPEDKAIQC